MIIVSSVRHIVKPDGYGQGILVKTIKDMVIGEYRDIQATEIAKAVESGHPILPNDLELGEDGKILGKKNKFFKGTKWLAYDIDDGATIQDVIDRCKKANVNISVLYPSFSHQSEHHKFRVLLKLKQYISDSDVYKWVWNRVGDIVTGGTQDKACKDLVRHYLGTKYKSIIANNDAVLDLAELLDDVIPVTELNESIVNNFVIDNAYCYKCKETKLKKEKAIKKTNEGMAQARQLIGLSSNKNYIKTDIMKQFEDGAWDELGGEPFVWKLMHLYRFIGDAETFINTIEKYHNEWLPNWEYQLEQAEINGNTPVKSLVDDFMNLNINETINYCNYKATEIHEIDKYISDKSTGYERLIIEATQGYKGLLVSPTGSGKTHAVVEYCKRNNIKSVFIVPNSSTVQQIMEQYKIPGAFGDLSLVEAMSKSKNIVVCTWDKVEQAKDEDLSKYIFILDEVHQAYTDLYRLSALTTMFSTLDKFVGGIDITATPKRVPFDGYHSIIEYKQKTQTKYNVKIYNSANADNKVIDIASNSKKFAVFLNDKARLENILKKSGKKVAQIDADTKEDSDTYRSIVATKSIGAIEGIGNTSVMVASVNILEPEMTDIIIIGVKDVAHIKQYVARFRDLKECNVHIFVNEPDEVVDTYSVEGFVSREINKAQEYVSMKNIEYNFEGKLIAIGCNTLKINLSDNIYFDKIDNCYKVNPIQLRGSIYTAYYNSRGLEQFKLLLNEYFDNIEIITIDESEENEGLKEIKEARKFNKAQALEFLEAEKQYLVGYSYISKNKAIPSKLAEYMADTNLSYDKKTLHCRGILDAIKSGKVGNIVSKFDKLVLDYGYSLDLAWKVAQMHGNKEKKFNDMLEVLAHRKTLKECPEAVNTTDTTKVFDYLVHRLQIGSEYNEAVILEIAEELNALNINVSPKKLKDFIGTIFISKRAEKTIDKKRYRYNIIEKIVEIEDIKKDLSLLAEDKSLQRIIDNKFNSYVDKMLEHLNILQSKNDVTEVA